MKKQNKKMRVKFNRINKNPNINNYKKNKIKK